MTQLKFGRHARIGYVVYSGGVVTPVRVRKAHGIWQYRLGDADDWRGTYATRIEAGSAGVGHWSDEQIEDRRTKST